MPLILNESDNSFGQLYIWRCTEEEKTITDYFDTLGFDYTICQNWHPKRRLEWLTGRMMISLHVPEPLDHLQSKTHSKPFFPNSLWDISLSHSHGLVALAKAEHTIGLDLQMHRHKTLSLFPKFGVEEELEMLKLHQSIENAVHQLWSIKESVYKAYNQPGLSFKNEITLIGVSTSKGINYAQVIVSREGRQFSCKVSTLDNYSLSIARPL